MRVRIATCLKLPELDADEPWLAEALHAAGFDAQLVAWDDPAADWDAPIPTLIRSTWNYSLHVEAFRAWIDRAAAAAPLFNPPAICHANLHKRYLLELAARGVPVVPTHLVERGQTADLPAVAAPWGAPRIVIKPAIGASSRDTERFAPSDPAAAAHLARLTAQGDALVQPYQTSVEGYGERSLVCLDGALSHSVRKTPRFGGDAEHVAGPFEIAEDERAVAAAALAPYGDLLYARVDLARDDAGRPMIMELELLEPSLFLEHQPGAAERLVAALARRLRAPA